MIFRGSLESFLITRDSNMSKKELIKILMKRTFIIYVIFFVLVLCLKAVFSFINEDDIVGNLMITFRSFALGTISSNEIFSTRFESIGLFAIHFILFFGFYFYIVIFDKKNIVASILILVIGIVLTIFMRGRFLFCIPEALIFAGIMGAIDAVGAKHCEPAIIGANVKIVKIYTISLFVLSIVATIVEIAPYIVDF